MSDKVMLVASSYLPNMGGLQVVVSRLASALQSRGFSINVVTQRYPRTLAAKEQVGTIEVQRLHFLVPRLRDLRRGRPDLFLAGIFYFPVTLILLIKLILKTKPGVINLHFLGQPALFLLAAQKVLRFRFVVSLHGDDVQGLKRGTWFDRWVFSATLQSADAIIACSQNLLTQVQAIEPGLAYKARVIYNGMDTVEQTGVKPPVDESNFGPIVAVGRLVPKKGIDVLLKAIQIARRQNNSIRLLLIGDGPERAALEKLADTLQLNNSVVFIGSQPHEQALRLIAESSIVVIPSREEPFGMVALEAMAAGKPVVATWVGGLPEVLDGADAILVAPEAPDALANALVAMQQRISQDPTFGERNHSLAKDFSTARMVIQYQTLYTSLLAHPK